MIVDHKIDQCQRQQCDGNQKEDTSLDLATLCSVTSHAIVFIFTYYVAKFFFVFLIQLPLNFDRFFLQKSSWFSFFVNFIQNFVWCLEDSFKRGSQCTRWVKLCKGRFLSFTQFLRPCTETHRYIHLWTPPHQLLKFITKFGADLRIRNP